MTEVAFYHLTRSSPGAALPKLLEKTLQAGKRAVVMAASQQHLDQLSEALWTADPSSWLPHGSVKDGQPQDQPIWLTAEDENPNGAQFVFLTDDATCADLNAYERCFTVFDGANASSVEHARQQWKVYKGEGFALTYWQQTEQGGWSKKDT